MVKSGFHWSSTQYENNSYRFFDESEIADWVGLSQICEDDSTFRQRQEDELRRPILIDGVEVGNAYRTDRFSATGGRLLSARGVTVALWYFLSRGHRAIAVLPSNFKYASANVDCINELMQLEKAGLVEFTTGDMFQRLAMGARKTDGCVVSRNQMHDIIKRWPQFKDTIESRLLMPCFCGVERTLMFPMDGPQGRFGISFQATIRTDSTTGTGQCARLQLTAVQQRYLMTTLVEIAGRPTQWVKLVNLLTDSSVPSIIQSSTSEASESPAQSDDSPPLGRSPTQCSSSSRATNGHLLDSRVREGSQSHPPPPSSDPDESWDDAYPSGLRPTFASSPTDRQPLGALAEIFGLKAAHFVTDLLPHVTDLETLVHFALDAEAFGNLPVDDDDDVPTSGAVRAQSDERVPDGSPSTESPVSYINFFRDARKDFPDLIQF